jgi:hypothetical protein
MIEGIYDECDDNDSDQDTNHNNENYNLDDDNYFNSNNNSFYKRKETNRIWKPTSKRFCI